MNILFLCNHKYYQRKMSRVRFHYVHALSEIPGVTVKYWGIGWPGYNPDLTVKVNIATDPVKFDVILCYKPLEHRGIATVPLPKIISYNEMSPIDRTLQEIRDSKMDVVVCHHLNEMLNFQKLLPETKFINIPHCSDVRFFKDFGMPRVYDILLVGRLSSAAYPLRSRMQAIVESLSSEWKVLVHAHPGYDIEDASDDHQTQKYVQLLNSAKLAVFCSGKDHTRFSKYTEVTACGTGAVADVPDEAHDEIRSFLIEINMNMTDQEIINVLLKYLNPDNNSELSCKIKTGKEFAAKYTTQYYANRLHTIINELIAT